MLIIPLCVLLYVNQLIRKIFRISAPIIKYITYFCAKIKKRYLFRIYIHYGKFNEH